MSSKSKYDALSLIAGDIIERSNENGIDTDQITVMLSYNFWHESLSDMMVNTSGCRDFLNVERERAFEIHGIKFIRGEK